MDACVGLGLLSKTNGTYANTPVAATYLCCASPRRLTGYLNWSNGYMWQLWSHLEDAVREGIAPLAAGVWVGRADLLALLQR